MYLNIIATIKDGLAIALVNYLSLVAAAALYVVTIWIPYLNVGTTIAMCSLLMSLMYGAIGVGFLFMGVPGLVLSVAWSFAAVLFVDKDMNALESLRESNRLTYGNKWRIFGSEALLAICLCVVVSIISAIFNAGNIGALQTIGTILNIIVIVFFVPAIYGVEASIYRQLTTDEFLAAPAAPEAPAPAPAPETPAAPAPEAPAAPAPEAPAPAPKKPAARKPAAKKPAAE